MHIRRYCHWWRLIAIHGHSLHVEQLNVFSQNVNEYIIKKLTKQFLRTCETLIKIIIYYEVFGSLLEFFRVFKVMLEFV